MLSFKYLNVYNGATGSEADRSLPTTAEIKNGGAIPSLPHMSSRNIA
jgi:hypothetical protein